MNPAKLAQLKVRRKKRIRFKLRLVNRSYRKRIYLFISNKHMYAQLIDELSKKTLIGVSTLSLDTKTNSKANKINAEKLGHLFFDKAVGDFLDEKEPILFDRGSRLYHGRVKIFAETLRKRGINF